MTETQSDSYAILLVDRLPHLLFDDMETAHEYAENHDRLDFQENAQVMWPIRTFEGEMPDD